MATPRLSDAKRKQIEKDLAAGLSNREIVKNRKVSSGTVSNVKNDLVKSPTDKADPTNAKILQLEAKNITLQDDVRRCTAAYKAAQRENSIFVALVDEMKKCVSPISPLPSAVKLKKRTKTIKETLVMHLTDEHADAVIQPHQVAGLETYDFQIALRRAEEYVDTTLKFTQRTLSNYQFDTLWVFAHGDHTSGEIHGAVHHSEYRNQFRNSLAIGQMHALMYRDLAQHFRDVKVLYLSGNHGRRSQKKDYKQPWNNWDYLVGETARMHSLDLKNVEFLIPESWQANIEIEGYGFCVSHGDDIRSWNNIPWYGIERKTRRLAALYASQDKKIDYYCFGHFHNPATQAALNGETIINGAWVAADPYAFNSMSVFTEPCQWIHGVHNDRGVSWRLNVKLATEKEKNGPQRYRVNLASEI
jgi:hypothetical protein